MAQKAILCDNKSYVTKKKDSCPFKNICAAQKRNTCKKKKAVDVNLKKCCESGKRLCCCTKIKIIV